MGGQGGCERKIEVFVKIQKKRIWGEGVSGGGGVVSGGGGGVGLGGGAGVRVDANKELKFLGKNSQKKNSGGVRWGSGWWGGGGQGGCERRIEVFLKIQKKNWGCRGGRGWVGGGRGRVGGGGSGWM